MHSTMLWITKVAMTSTRVRCFEYSTLPLCSSSSSILDYDLWSLEAVLYCILCCIQTADRPVLDHQLHRATPHVMMMMMMMPSILVCLPWPLGTCLPTVMQSPFPKLLPNMHWGLPCPLTDPHSQDYPAATLHECVPLNEWAISWNR